MQQLSIGPAAADDVEPLVEVINAAYAVGEDGLWAEGTERVSPEQVAAILRAGEFLRAELDGRLMGCARVQRLDGATAELGLVSVAPEQWGNGVGGALVEAAEEHARGLGAELMELKVLTPIEGVHDQKVTLRAWYERIGYRFVRAEPLEADSLATPCEFECFRKPLR
jgi:N-acetylglutamate synthase-like GNAT family acetyltransferase